MRRRTRQADSGTNSVSRRCPDNGGGRAGRPRAKEKAEAFFATLESHQAAPLSHLLLPVDGCKSRNSCRHRPSLPPLPIVLHGTGPTSPRCDFHESPTRSADAVVASALGCCSAGTPAGSTRVSLVSSLQSVGPTSRNDVQEVGRHRWGDTMSAIRQNQPGPIR
jgi:hypothetical protein